METPDLVRRRLLAASGGVVALAGSARVALADLPGQENAAAPAEKVAKETALPDYAAWKDADSKLAIENL